MPALQGRSEQAATARQSLRFGAGEAQEFRLPGSTMELEEILERLERCDGRFAREAVEAAALCRDEITPELLRILEDLAEDPAGLDAEGDSMAHLYAMLLLAQFRETRAYPLVLKIAVLPGDLLESLFGDFVTESFGKVMASVCDGDLAPIQSLIENRDASEHARGAAVSSLVTLAVEERAERSEIVGYFRELFLGRLPREESEPWNQMVSAACDLHPGELMAEIEAAYDDELVDPSYVSWEDVQHCFGMGRQRAIAETLGNTHHRLVRDTVEEMGWWASFQENEDRVSAGATGAGAATRTNDAPAFAVTSTIHKPPKTGRNDPCPCGSGKKYKKCCGG